MIVPPYHQAAQFVSSGCLGARYDWGRRAYRSPDPLDKHLSLAVAETGNVGKEVGVVDVSRRLVDVDTDFVRHFDQASFEGFDDLFLGQLFSRARCSVQANVIEIRTLLRIFDSDRK